MERHSDERARRRAAPRGARRRRLGQLPGPRVEPLQGGRRPHPHRRLRRRSSRSGSTAGARRASGSSRASSSSATSRTSATRSRSRSTTRRRRTRSSTTRSSPPPASRRTRCASRSGSSTSTTSSPTSTRRSPRRARRSRSDRASTGRLGRPRRDAAGRPLHRGRPARARVGRDARPGRGRLRDLRDARRRTASNAVFVCHALTGDAHAAGHHGDPDAAGLVGRADRPGQAGRHRPPLRRLPEPARRLPGARPGRPRSTRRPAGPTGCASRSSTVADLVTVHRRLLAHLGIARLHAAIGGSLGGMQVLQWALDHPDEIDDAHPRLRQRAPERPEHRVLAPSRARRS